LTNGAANGSFDSSRNGTSIHGSLEHERHQFQPTSVNNQTSAVVPPPLSPVTISSDQEGNIPGTPDSPPLNPSHSPHVHITGEITVDGSSRLTSYRPFSKDSSVFEHASRIPTSPLTTITTPRKPKPPGRYRAAARPQAYLSSKSRINEDDPLLLAADTHEPTQTSHHYNTRRQSRSLEEEMIEADAQHVEDLSENGSLVGVGARDLKGGFLARGGAGGEPIFMSEGYVREYQQNAPVGQHRKTRR
jgi:hypothetical protein